HDLLECGALLRLRGRAGFPGGEELRQLIAAEGVTKHAKRARRVAEAFGGLGRGRTFNIEGAQCLVLALARRAWLAEAAAGLCYIFWYPDHYESTMSNQNSFVKRKSHRMAPHARNPQITVLSYPLLQDRRQHTLRSLEICECAFVPMYILDVIT